MNSLAITTLIALRLFLNTYISQSSWDKQAVADTQRTLASNLDAGLPRLPFGDWFEKVVGPGSGVVWQLSECGEVAEPTPNVTMDLRACVEANSLLPDGRKVVVMIAVGTFKKGITGAPTFHFCVIVQKGEMYTVRRLRDLQRMLSAPGKPAYGFAVNLPEVNMPNIRLAANDAYVAVSPAPNGAELGLLIPDEEPPPAPPPGTRSAATNSTSNAENSNVSGAVRQGAAIVKSQPTYPRGAIKFKASGTVEVQITISETGRVTAAMAISGHPLLRKVAEEAARRWEFQPTTVKGVPIETNLVLSFVFSVPQ